MIYHIWTDGSCRQNPGPGGYGAICLDNHKKFGHTTKNSYLQF